MKAVSFYVLFILFLFIAYISVVLDISWNVRNFLFSVICSFVAPVNIVIYSM